VVSNGVMDGQRREPPAKAQRPLRLGGRDFLLIVSVLVGLTAVLAIVLLPDVSNAIARHDIRRREVTYGFTTGSVRSSAAFPCAGMWGIVTVVPGGAFAKAGVRAGDVPYGDGQELVYALEESEAGRAATFRVFDCSGPSGQGGRVIQLPPTPRVR
jgi:hypothetical protein